MRERYGHHRSSVTTPWEYFFSLVFPSFIVIHSLSLKYRTPWFTFVGNFELKGDQTSLQDVALFWSYSTRHLVSQCSFWFDTISLKNNEIHYDSNSQMSQLRPLTSWSGLKVSQRILPTSEWLLYHHNIFWCEASSLINYKCLWSKLIW